MKHTEPVAVKPVQGGKTLNIIHSDETQQGGLEIHLCLACAVAGG